ncbi:MAG: type VI secretion system baseplate subunit TssG, partial [Nannocystaceae bacterium]
MNALKPRDASQLEAKPKELRELAKLVSTIYRNVANTQTSSRGLRVCSALDAAFSPGDWSQVTYHPSGLYHLVTNTLSLLGVDSPLPPALVRLLTDRVEACLATRALFDALHTRLLACLCQGLCALDLHTRSSGQRWPHKVLALSGLRQSD